MAAVLFAGTLALFTRHNDFPFSYHPDEPGKVGQIIKGSRNYHHPLLLLSTTEYVSRLGFVPRSPQPIVETGRWVSAAFAAGSVVALALIVWLHYGALAACGAGVALALQADLFEMAHYMKEDPALMFGLALALLATHLWWRFPGRRTLRFLGIACGLAVSGKYLGIVTLAFALPLVIWCRAADSTLDRRARLKLFALAFGITFLAANLPLFAHEISSPFRSIGNEMHGVAGGHRGLTRKIPHGVYLDSLRENLPPATAILAGAYALALLATVRRRTPPEWVSLLFPLAYLTMLSFSPKIAERYLLPVSVLLPFLGALGAAEIGRSIGSSSSRLRTVLGGLVATGLLAWMIRAEMPTFELFFKVVFWRTPMEPNHELQTSSFSREFFGFQHDDPTAAAEWIKTNLPLDAVIAEDHRVNLSATKAEGLSTNARVPQKVLDASFAPDLGTLDELRAKGVTHVAVCRQSYGRYFNDETKPQAGVKTGYDKRRDFYGRVFAEGELLKEWKKGPIAYLQPGIKLYRVVPPKESPEGAAL